MDTDREYRAGQVPLPGFGGSAPAERPAPDERPAPARDGGIRRVRRMSNWTAAALIVGTGAATVALAHHAVPAAVPVAAASSATTGAGAGATAGQPASGPQVTHSVATASGSGVTVTTTHKANGQTIVTRTRHATYQDN
jgi:hypothetical protein